MYPTVADPLAESRVVEGSEVAPTDYGAQAEGAPYPEIRGLSSPPSPRKVPAASQLAAALPVTRPPSSWPFFGGGRRS